MSDKVKVISAFDGRCGIDNSDLHISRRWPARGSHVMLDRNIVEELMYDDAFKNMVEDGTLYIEDFELKKELGIEPEDAKTPTIVYLGDKELERYWKVMPLSQFKVEVKNLKKRNVLKGIELRKSVEG